MELLLTLHSYLAYIVLIALVLAVANTFKGWLTHKTIFDMGKDLRLSLFALILTHIQLLFGLAVYVTSSKGVQAFSVDGMMGNSALRLLAVEHPFVNILAVALITIGWSKHKKKMEANAKFKTIAVFYGLGLLLILSRIPWSQWI